MCQAIQYAKTSRICEIKYAKTKRSKAEAAKAEEAEKKEEALEKEQAEKAETAGGCTTVSGASRWLKKHQKECTAATATAAEFGANPRRVRIARHAQFRLLERQFVKGIADSHVNFETTIPNIIGYPEHKRCLLQVVSATFYSSRTEHFGQQPTNCSSETPVEDTILDLDHTK